MTREVFQTSYMDGPSIPDYIDDEAEDNVVLSPRSRRKRTERKTFIRDAKSPPKLN